MGWDWGWDRMGLGLGWDGIGAGMGRDEIRAWRDVMGCGCDLDVAEIGWIAAHHHRQR